MSHVQWLEEFDNRMGKAAERVRFFHAPGRVNLIGEHIDYNGGLVLPAALHIGTTLMIRPRQDQWVRLASLQFPETGEASIHALPEAKADVWTDYVYGVMQELAVDNKPVRHGYDILITGNIPNGSGLSSSASLEVVVGYALMTMEGYAIDRTKLAVLSQRAENGFVGVNSGIMDQFAVSQGKKDHAILLNCDTLAYEHVPFQIQGYKLVIGNTKKRRGLVDSKYNERRSQCEAALAVLKTVHPKLEYLAHLSPDAFEQAKQAIEDETVSNRAQHVVYENERVKQSMTALSQGDLKVFGELMNASHMSLRDLYEVSCTELDVMVEAALAIEGTLGSRMTGAGFGGCTVSLVKEGAVPAFIEGVGAHYEAKTGITPEFYVCEVGDGVHECSYEATITEV